jgi:hypothetical protein
VNLSSSTGSTVRRDTFDADRPDLTAMVSLPAWTCTSKNPEWILILRVSSICFFGTGSFQFHAKPPEHGFDFASREAA